MTNLQKGAYTRDELEAIFGTKRTDSMKRSLLREGYKFDCSGRGQNYTITITGLPDAPPPFEEFIMRELGCSKQTNFRARQHQLFLIFEEPDYRFFPYKYQAMILKEKYGIEISGQALSNWEKKLIDKNWFSRGGDRIAYFLCRSEQAPQEISEETYKAAWNYFYGLREEGIPDNAARKMMYYKYGGMPLKKLGILENGIELKTINVLHDILLDSGISLQSGCQD